MLLAWFRVLSWSRTHPILWHTPLLLHASVCISPLAVMTIVGLHDFVKVSIFQHHSSLFCWSYALTHRSRQQILVLRFDGGKHPWNTQPNCRAFDDRRPVGPCFNSWQVSRLTSGLPGLSWLLSRLTTGCRMLSCRSFFFNMATALLSSFLLDLLLGCSSTWRCVRASTFPQTDNHSWSCRTSTLEGATFHRTSCCKFLWGNPCKAIDTFYHRGFFSRDFGFSTLFSHSAAWKNSETYSIVSFFHADDIVAETAIVSFHTLPVGFPLPPISKNSLYTLFCPLILDHGVSLIISISGAKILISYALLDTSFYHCLQSVIIRS